MSARWSSKERLPILPILFRFLVPKPCKTAKFSNQLNVFPMSPVFVTTPFLVPTPKSAFFRVRRRKWCPSLQVRSFSAENRLQTSPNSVFCPEKPANSSPLNSSPLVTALSPLAFWVQKCAKPFPSSFFAGFFAVRQPAEDQARSPTARRGGPSAR